MQHQEEQLSAFIDDELDVPSAAIVSRLMEDETRRGQWARYHLIGDVLRDGDAARAHAVSAKVRRALDAEPTLLAPQRWSDMKPATSSPSAAGRAVAAGLAAIGLGGILLVGQAPDRSTTAGLAQTAMPMASPAMPLGTPEPRTVNWDEAVPESAANPQTIEFQRRLNSYLVNFNEQRANLGVPSVHPYVRIVGFEAEPDR